jgi:hypothetical protein
LSSRCDAELPLRPGLWLRNLPIKACSQGDCTYAAAWFGASALPKNACSSIAWATAPAASSKSPLSKLSRTHKSSPLCTLSSETVPDRALTTFGPRRLQISDMRVLRRAPGLNRHVAGDERALQEGRKRIHLGPESCGGYCHIALEKSDVGVAAAISGRNDSGALWLSGR